MKKSHAFNIMSDLVCRCGRKIKLRLAGTGKARKCFKCHKKLEAARGHFIKRIPYLAFKKHIK